MLAAFVLTWVDPRPVMSGQIEFWVSPEGNDSWPGTALQPFKSLEVARNAVRNSHRDGLGAIYINLYGGVHRLDKTLELDSRDSGTDDGAVVYRAVKGQVPVVCGSIPVEGWWLHDSARGIYAAKVGHVESRQFYVNGERAKRARTGDFPASFVPHFISDFIPDVNAPCDPNLSRVPVSGGGGIEYIVDPLNPEGWRDPHKWTNQDRIEAVILTQWKSMRCMIQEVTDEPGTLKPGSSLIKMQTPGWWNANMFRNAKVSLPGAVEELLKEVHLYGLVEDFLNSADGLPGIWSFWEVSYFENAYQFLDEPGEWYLDQDAGVIYYIPREGEDIFSSRAELPVMEKLIEGRGSPDAPVENIRFEGITFSYGTWNGPSSGNGYVSDQSGFHVEGYGHKTNFTGHVENVVRTPGNISFVYAHNIGFRNNVIAHMGGVGIDFGTGSQGNRIEGNRFQDISSTAIQVGGVQKYDARPEHPSQLTRDNLIMNNTINYAGQEFFDVAGIYVGFTERTTVKFNHINHVPWSGIAAGWGWGLLDQGSFQGAPDSCPDQWGAFNTPTVNRVNRILYNRVENFLEVLWDGGAVYTLGQQGHDMESGMLISGNVAMGKRQSGGGNIFYTDGGSRYITLEENVSLDNPVGYFDLGGCGPAGQLLPNPSQEIMCRIIDLKIPYGGEIGGCRTYGENTYINNYFGDYKFYDICPYELNGIKYPTDLTFQGNHPVSEEDQVPWGIINRAGVGRLSR